MTALPRAWERLTTLPLALLCLGLLFALLAELPGGAIVAQDDRPMVAVARVDGAITPVMARYVERVIGDAVDDGASAIVIELDTPGGLGSAMDDITQDIVESDIPVIVYVSPTGARADSAGVFITYAAHVAAMAPGTNIGSASPVTSEGGDLDETMQAKVENDAVARITNLANLRGRNAEWAESAVREAANITADEALALNVINLIAADLTTLLNEADGMTVTMPEGSTVVQTAGANTSEYNTNFIEDLLQIVTDPTIAYILLSIGMLGIFFELSSPGGVVPGVVGVLGLVLGLFGLGTLPVNWTGALLILLAFVLFVLDLYVPSLGGLTIAGLVSFVIGSYMLLDTNGPPGTRISKEAIWIMTGLLVLLFGAIGYLVVRSTRRKPTTGSTGLLNEVAEVRRPLNPDGMVFVFGELWSATLEPGAGHSAEVGSHVVVTEVDGLRLHVRPATITELAPPNSIAAPA